MSPKVVAVFAVLVLGLLSVALLVDMSYATDEKKLADMFYLLLLWKAAGSLAVLYVIVHFVRKFW